MWAAHAMTLVIHGPAILGATLFVSPLGAMSVGTAMLVTTATRLQGLVREERRPRWVTLLLDEPILLHWCACWLAAVVFFPLLLIALLFTGAIGLYHAPPGRALAGAGAASYAIALIVAAYGTWLRRRRVHVVHLDIPIVGLPAELDGYRIAQISDLHIGNHDTKARGLEWAARVNRLEPDLVAVTGDLVTTGTRFYQDVADVLGALDAKDGVFVSMGNHDQWNPDELTRLIELRGPRVLRNAWQSVRRGPAELVVAGIDDRMSGKDDLDLTLRARPGRAPTVLLSHFPDFFEEAARRRVDLVLSGQPCELVEPRAPSAARPPHPRRQPPLRERRARHDRTPVPAGRGAGDRGAGASAGVRRGSGRVDSIRL